MSSGDDAKVDSHLPRVATPANTLVALLIGHRHVGLPASLALVTVLWCAGAVLLLAAGASYTSVWLNDQFGLVAAGYRVSTGQVPSVDFRSIYGFITFLPIAAALKFGVTPGLAIPAAHAMVSLLLLLLVALAVSRRLGVVTAMLFALAVHTVTIAPIVMGKSPLEAMSFGVFYNRHGWAFLAVAFLCFLEPRDPRRRDVAIDAIVIASVLAFLAYSIFNFAVIAAGILLANACTSAHKARATAIAMLLCALFAASVELAFPGYHHAYISQLFPPTGFVSQSTPGVNRIIGALLNDGMTDAALCLLAVLAYALVSRSWLVPAAFALGSLLGCVVLTTQTGSGTTGMPALVGVLVCLAELTRRSAARHSAPVASGATGNAAIAMPLMAMAVVIVAVAQPVTTNALAMLFFHQNADAMSTEQAALAPPAALAGFRVGPWKQDAIGLVLGYEGERGQDGMRIRRELRSPLATAAYYETVVEGTRLLERMNVTARHRLVVFDKVDPFTFTLGLRPTCHGIPLFWADRINDPRRVPAAAEFFADADLVMVPKAPYDQSQLDAMMKYYGAHLNANYAPSGESRRWRLWVRTSPTPQGCPFPA